MKLLDIHSHTQTSSENTIVIQNQYPLTANTSSWFSVGMHPWHFSVDNWQKQWEALEKVATDEKCLAIGECGLDKNICKNIEFQQYIFEKHIDLSEKLKKPLIIHCVKAYAEVISMKKIIRPKQPWILHGFTKNQTVANMLLQHGLILSFGKALLTNKNVQEVFKNLPDKRYFFETDDANVPISKIYQKAIELRGELDFSTDFFPKLFF